MIGNENLQRLKLKCDNDEHDNVIMMMLMMMMTIMLTMIVVMVMMMIFSSVSLESLYAAELEP